MSKKSLIIFALQTFIIIVLFWMLVFYGSDEYEASRVAEDEVIASSSHIASEDGTVTLTLSPASQQQSGIATSRLQAATHQTESTSFGLVLGIDSLIDLRTRYLAARAEAGVVKVALANSRRDYERMAQLNQDDRNVSDRALAAAEAAWKSDEASLAAADSAAASLHDAMRQQWGETLANWATEQPAGAAMQGLLQRRQVLLQITLTEAVADKGVPLMIQPTGSAEQAVKAHWLSAAPATDAAIQGRTYYYLALAASLRAGMRVTAVVTGTGKSTSGVIVPSAAVIWYANQPWVYQKQAADKFVRRRINTDSESRDGWFNSGGLAPGDEVVTRGAQLLLSEEFKYQIKNENED